MNIGFVSASGNIGKSTLSLNFIVSLLEEYENNIIVGVDADERIKSLSRLMAKRKKNNFSFVKVVSDVNEIGEQLAKKNVINIVDLKGHIGKKEALIMDQLDLILVVTNNENMVVHKTYEFCKDLHEANFNFKVVVNQYREKIGKSKEQLQKIFKNKLLNSFVQRRDSYTRVDETGQTDYDRFLSGIGGLYRTKREIDNLRDEILKVAKLIK